MPRPSLIALDAQRHAITQRALAGSSAHEILSWLHDLGVTTSLASLKRRLKEWREADALPIGRRPSSNDQAVQSAILDLLARVQVQQQQQQQQQRQQHRFGSGVGEHGWDGTDLLPPLPSDEDIRDALKDRFRLSCRQIREVRLRHQIRRREKRLMRRLPEGLVEAVLERCTAPATAIATTSTAAGDGDGVVSGNFELPKDDELVVKMRVAGFETAEREIRAIRHRHGIKHVCRGANRYGQRRAVLHSTPPLSLDSDAGEGGSDRDEDDNRRGVEEGLVDAELPPASKLVQDRHFTVVTLDADATLQIRQIAKPISRLVYDNVGAGLRRARQPQQVATIAQGLLRCLRVQPPCTLTSMYVSNHYIVPDAMFGIWVIPLMIHVERETVSDDDDNDEEEGEEFLVTEMLGPAGHEYLIDDHAVRIGQAIYLTKPAAVHTRLTVLILSR